MLDDNARPDDDSRRGGSEADLVGDTNWPWTLPSGPSVGADRGQATMIGVIFVVVIVLGLFTFAQTTLAPQIRNNEEIEHGSQIVTDFQGIHGNTLTAATTGQPGSSVLQMGTDYPGGVLIYHPPDPAGAIRTGDPKSVELANVEATNDETADYLDGSTQQYEYQPLRYTPFYNEFKTAGDSVIEFGVFYQDYDSEVEIVGQPNVVEGNTIRLMATTGDMNIGAGTGRLIQTKPLSASQQTVIVEDTGSRPEIRFESNLDVSIWREMLSDEIDGNGSPLNDRYVHQVRDGSGDTIVIKMEQGSTYEVNTAKLHHKMSDQPAAAKSEVPDVAYLTTTQATETTVSAGGTKQFTLEVRDIFNNPLANEAIAATTSHPDSSVDAITKVSRSDGTVTLIYRAPSSSATPPDDDTLTVELASASGVPNDQATVQFTINIDS